MPYNEEYDPVDQNDGMDYTEDVDNNMSSDMIRTDKDRSHFQNVKNPGGVRHRGPHGFNYNCQHPMRMNPNNPHLNNNQPYYSAPEFGRNRYPVAGCMQENAFMLINSEPYLWDNTGFHYGQRILVGDSVYTRVLQRRDPSSINLTGVFDMTQSMTNNISLNYYLGEVIKHRFHQLQGLMPIIKSQIMYRINYTVTDLSGGVIHNGVITTTHQEHRFHSTDVKDYYLLSDTGVMITHIPQIDFQGPYILTLEKVTAIVDIIDVAKHVENFLNPFYQWTNNNQKIFVDNDVIRRHRSDFIVTIAEADIKFSTQFDGNLTTKLKVSFTAFLSNIIATKDTFQVWQMLHDVDGAVIRTIQHNIVDLQKDTRVLDEDLTALENRVTVTEDDISDLKDNSDEFRKKLTQERKQRIKGDEMLDERLTMIENKPIECPDSCDCTCKEHPGDEPDPDCPKCNGTGKVLQWEKI